MATPVSATSSNTPAPVQSKEEHAVAGGPGQGGAQCSIVQAS
jgi:hypothetical protein